MPKAINPLRYPGAKRQLIPYVKKLLEANNLTRCTFYEPYAGSAVIGLELLQQEILDKLVIIEKDVLIYSFWKCLFNYPDEMCRRIEEIEINIDTWKDLKPLRDVTSPQGADLLDLGVAGIFFNRTNFSGIMKANPIGGLKQESKYSIDCRFNKKTLIKLITSISHYKDRVEVHWDDALNFLNNVKRRFIMETSFVYFDPPYYRKGKQLYRHFYRDKDHKELALFVKNNNNFDWLISYDDDPYICGLYSGTKAQYLPFYLDYSVSSGNRSKGNELLISNLPLPPIKLSNLEDNTFIG